MLTRKGAIPILLFLCVLFLSGQAYALKFNGDAWFAEHYASDQSTDEYFVIMDNSEVDINPNKVKVKGLKFKNSPTARDFFLLTGKKGTEGTTWFEVDNENSYIIKKLNKKAKKISKKKMNKGKLDAGDRQEWMDDYVDAKLQNKTFALVFKDMDGKKYKSRISFARFDNPVNGEIPNGNGEPQSVPEPTTMLLLGAGLLGVAAMRRRFK